jgi:uncharacterized phiE125 gp8 family phage protein
MKITTTQLIVAPAEEPLSIKEARDNMRGTSTAEDPIIFRLLQTARRHAEEVTGRRFVTQTREVSLDEFPGDVFEMPDAPLRSIVSVKYLDENGTEQTLASTVYQVDLKSDPGRIALAHNQTWPTIRSYTFNPIVIRYTCGYGLSGSVPAEIKQAILLMVGHWFEHREAVSDDQFYEVPMAANALLSTYRFLRV